MSFGVVAKTFAVERVNAVLEATSKQSQRRRDLPAPVGVYYALAWAFNKQVSYREVLRCWLEAIQWLQGPENETPVAGKSGISQARTRVGWEPLRQLLMTRSWVPSRRRGRSGLGTEKEKRTGPMRTPRGHTYSQPRNL